MENGFDFYLACKNGDLKSCMSLFHMKYLSQTFENNQYTPILISISKQHFHILRFLLTNHANPNQSTFLLKSPLHMAIPTMNLKICKLLLDFGSSLEHVDKNGHTPLHIACFYKPKILKLLLSRKAPSLKNLITGATPLHLSSLFIADGFTKIDMLVKYGTGVNINEKDSLKKETPLHYAVKKQLFKNCEMLLYHGADLFAKNNNNTTPYDFMAISSTNIKELFTFHSKKELLLLLI